MAWNIRTATTPVKPDLEILVQQANVDVAASIVLDASAVTPDAVTGERKLLAGQPLKKVGNQYVPWLTADGAALCLGILVRTEVFPDASAQSDIASAMWHHGQWFRANRIVTDAPGLVLVRQALPTCKFS
jgi:hypothetical protein